MKTEWDIGKEAKKIDELSFREKMKISKMTFSKLVGAILFYILIMSIFSIFL